MNQQRQRSPRPVQEILITSFEESFFLSGSSLKKRSKMFSAKRFQQKVAVALGSNRRRVAKFWAPKIAQLCSINCPIWLKCIRNWHLFILFAALLTARFPTAGLLAAQVRADWVLDWSLAATWAWLLIFYLADAIPTHQRSKNDKGCCSLLLIHKR